MSEETAEEVEKELEGTEELVRAVCTDKFDKDKGTISPSLMMGPDTSVSRTKVIPLNDHWELFRRCVQKPEKERLLVMISTIDIDSLRSVAAVHDKEASTRHDIKVVISPNECWTPREGHAEIKGKISRGLANKLIGKLIYWKEDRSSWDYDGSKLTRRR